MLYFVFKDYYIFFLLLGVGMIGIFRVNLGVFWDLQNYIIECNFFFFFLEEIYLIKDIFFYQYEMIFQYESLRIQGLIYENSKVSNK